MKLPAHAILATGLLLACGCAAAHPWDLRPQPVTGVPERFVNSTASPLGERSVAGCAKKLADPRDNTQLTLIRSTARGSPAEYWGDYEVAHGERYRLGPLDLLRVDCATGRPLGRVSRRG